MTKKPETIKEEDLVEKNGTWFKKYSRKPFTGCVVDYHENGQLQYKGNWKDGNEDGPFKTFYPDGQLESKGNYKDREEDGLWEEYYENGQLKEKGNYKDGKLIG